MVVDPEIHRVAGRVAGRHVAVVPAVGVVPDHAEHGPPMVRMEAVADLEEQRPEGAPRVAGRQPFTFVVPRHRGEVARLASMKVHDGEELAARRREAASMAAGNHDVEDVIAHALVLRVRRFRPSRHRR